MLKQDIDELEVGDWCFINDELYIAIRLGPDQDRDFCILPIVKGAHPDATSWRWNGNREAPTLSPSILHWGNGRESPETWHGYLTDGKLVKV